MQSTGGESDCVRGNEIINGQMLMLGRYKQPKSEETEVPRGFDAFEMRLGDMMRGERATMGKSLLDVQRELKIKATYIAAVENSDPTVFETPGFIAGYVRSYARYLGMDPDWAYGRFCEESGFAGVEGLSGNSSATRKEAVARARPVGEEAIIRPVAPYAPLGESVWSKIEPGAIGSVAVLFGLIGLIGYGGYSVLQEIQRVQFAPVDQSPGLSADVSTLPSGPQVTGTAELASGFVAPAPDALDRLYRPQALEAPVLTARDGPIAALNPNTIGTLVGAVDPRLARAVEINLAEEEAQQAATPQVLVDDTPDVVLFATRPAWVRVANADGSVLFEKILDAGETYVLPQTDETPVLRAGNSGSLFFSVKGETYGPAGPGTSVAKNVALGVDAIMESYSVADVTDPLLSETLTAMAATPLAAPDANGITNGVASE